MLVSRQDIITEHFVDYGKDRFMKVPIEHYLDELGITANPTQVAIINAVNNPKYRFISAAVSRRLGKTYIANIIGQVVTLMPGASVLIMSPNYRLSQISFELQRSLIKQFSLEVVKDNAKDSTIELSNGSTIRIGSVNQVDSVVGRSYDLIIFDEAALTNEGEEAFNVALRPTLDKPQSKAIFISTPRGKHNWFSVFYDRGFSDEYPQWASIHATYRDNPRISEDDIDEARKAMSEAEFRQEYEASFESYEGRIWQFDEDNIRDLSLLDTSSMDILAGLDHGYKDPCAYVVLAYDEKTDCFYALAEYQKAQDTTARHAKELRYLIDKYQVDFNYIDAAAAQFAADLIAEYDIGTIKAKKSVLDGIAYVGAITENNRLIVDQRCTNLIKSLSEYRWDSRITTREKPLHDNFSHMADALRYALYSHQVSVGSF